MLAPPDQYFLTPFFLTNNLVKCQPYVQQRIRDARSRQGPRSIEVGSVKKSISCSKCSKETSKTVPGVEVDVVIASSRQDSISFTPLGKPSLEKQDQGLPSMFPLRYSCLEFCVKWIIVEIQHASLVPPMSYRISIMFH